jgi:hypothetical protein
LHTVSKHAAYRVRIEAELFSPAYPASDPRPATVVIEIIASVAFGLGGLIRFLREPAIETLDIASVSILEAKLVKPGEDIVVKIEPQITSQGFRVLEKRVFNGPSQNSRDREQVFCRFGKRDELSDGRLDSLTVSGALV